MHTKKNIQKMIGAGLFLLGLFMGQATYSQTRPEVGKYAKVYKGTEGIQVTILRVGAAEKNEVLFEVVGIDHPMDGKILKLKVTENGANADYAGKNGGKDWVYFTKRGDGTYANLEVYLPNNGTKETTYKVYYDEGLSRESKPEWILTEYLKQQEAGAVKKK